MTTKNISNAIFIAAPALLFLYGIAHFFDGLDGNYGPGFFWSIGHVLFLLALITFGAIIVLLRRRIKNANASSLSRSIAMAAMIIGLIGLIVFIRVALIDIITGISAVNNAAMGAISGRLNAYPSLALVPFYDLGPLFFQLGLLVLMLQLAIQKPRQIPWWSPAVLLAGFLVLGSDTNLLIPGAILIGIALVQLF